MDAESSETPLSRPHFADDRVPAAGPVDNVFASAPAAEAPPPIDASLLTAVFGAPPAAIGRVSAVSGTPSAVDAAGKPEMLHPGDAVFLGDVLQAGSDGHLSISLRDGSTIHLGPGARVLLEGSSDAAAATAMQLYLQKGDLIVLPPATLSAFGGIELHSPGGSVHGTGPLLAHAAPGAGLEVTLLPSPHGEAELDVVLAGHRGHLGAPFDHASIADAATGGLRLEHLTCTDPRLDFAAQAGITDGQCGADGKTADALETSPGGDMAADSGTFTVTQPVAAFDLKPEAAPLAEPPADPLVGAPAHFSFRSHLSDLLLQGTQDFTDQATAAASSGTQAKTYDFSLMQLWDPGHTWRGLGSHAELAPFASEVPLESGRLITARAGEMAQLEAREASAGEIEAFLGLDNGRLQLAMPQASVGSGGAAMRLEGTIHLEAGQSIWFDTFFDAADAAPVGTDGQSFHDFAVLTVSVHGQAMVVPIAEETPEIAAFGATGWQSVKYTAGVAGDYGFGFAVINDGGGPSRLYVDNVRTADTSGFTYSDLASRQDGLGGTLQILAPQPIANNDTITASAGAPTAIHAAQLLANDVDPDTFDGWRIVGVDAAATHGRVTFASGQPIVYDPHGAFAGLADGETGTDSFKYVLDGGNGLQATATVTLQVIGVNDAPTPAHDFIAAVAAREDGAAITIPNILAAATDVDSDFTPTSLHVIDAIAASGATIKLAGDRGQTLVYDPSTTKAFEYLAVGETAQDSVTYTIADQHGATATGHVLITVQGTNDAPTALADVAATGQDTAVIIAAVSNDTDPDASDRLQVVAIDGGSLTQAAPVTLASGATVALAADGRLIYNPNGAFVSLAAGETGRDEFHYQVSDGHGGLADASVALTIIGVNDAPLAAADVCDIAEDGMTSIRIADLLANDGDPDHGDHIRLTAVSDQGSPLTVYVVGERLVFDPGDHFQYLAEGETATQTVHYTLTDDTGATATAAITVTIHGANDVPIATADAVETVEEKQRITLDVLANDRDPDLSDKLTIASVGGQTVHPGDTVTLASGAHVTLQADGKLAYDPTGAFVHLGFQERATDMFAYTVSDGHGGTAEATVSVGISGVNDAPVATDDVGGTITQAGGFTVNVLANDHDPDQHDVLSVIEVNGKALTLGNPLYLSSSDPSTSDWVLVNGGGQLTYNPGSRFAYLGGGEAAAVTLNYTISDSLDARAEGKITFTVTGSNDAPQAVDDGGYGVDSKTVLTFPAIGGVLANDHDPDAHDTIHVAAVEGSALSVGQTIALHSGALLTLNADGSFRYDPNGAFNWLKPFATANETFSYTVGDDHGATASATATVEIQGHPNEPPTAVADAVAVDANAGVRLYPLANDSDPEGAHLQIIAIDDAHKNYVRINPDGTLTYDTAGRFDWLAKGQTATDTFSYTIDDDLGGRATAEVTVTIVGTGSATTLKQTLVESFEQPHGSLVAGWGYEAAAGAVSLVSGLTTALAPYGPTQSATAVLLRGEGVAARDTSPALQDYLGLPFNSLPKDAADGAGLVSTAVNGGAIKTAIVFTAADLNPQGKLIVSFDWNFLSAESVPAYQPGFNDYAVFTVSDGTTSKILTLADARATGLGASGWRTSTYDLTSLFGADILAGHALTLGFAAINDQDNQRPSSLLLDNLRINAPVASDASLLHSSEGGTFLTYQHAPTAVADATAALTTTADTPLVIAPATLLANDIPSPGASSISFVGLDGAAGQGTVSYANGQIVYNPNGKFAALALGEVGTDTLHYQITDANGGVGRGEVTVQITGLNDAPTTTAFVAPIPATENGAPITIANVLAHADDIDADDDATTLHVLGASAVSGAEVHLSGDRGQDFIYDPSKTAAFESLGSGETATDTITYTVADRHGATTTGQLTVTVQGTNDTPTAGNDAFAVDEDHVANLAVLANDSDPDRNDTLKVVRINGQAISVGSPVALASGALVLLAADGRLQFDANHAYDRLPAGASESVSFAYTASDSHGGFADAVVALTITGLNDAPLPGADTLYADEDHPLSVQASALLANDRDPDTGDLLHVTAVQGAGVAFDGTTLTYDPGTRFQSLGVGESATQHLIYTVSDSHGATTQGDIAVTIEGRNDAPHAVADAATTPENQAVTLTPLGNDTDPDTSDQGHLSILSIDTHGTMGSVTLNADGSIGYDPAHHFDYLNGGQTATDVFSYTVSDGHGGTDTTTVTMTIDGRNSLEQIVQSFETPFYFGSDPSVTRVNSYVVTATTYKETDVTPNHTYAPTDGSTMVKLEAYGSTIGAVETFLGLSTGAIKATFPDADGSSPAASAAMKLTISVHAGDQVSFDWMFDARDYVNNPPDGKADNDMAVLSVTGADGINLYKLSDVRQTGDLGASGWRSSTYTAQHDGTLTIGMASINDRTSETSGSTSQNSLLLVDNIRLNHDFDASYQLTQTSDDHHFHTYVHA